MQTATKTQNNFQTDFLDLRLGDCMEGMKDFPDNHFDLAIVDPPYGGNDAINRKSSDSVRQCKRRNYKEFENVAPTQVYFKEVLRLSKRLIIWGCNFYEYPLIGGRIVWNKNGTAFGEAEIAYYSHSKSVKIFEYTWNGMIQGDMKNKEHRIHPTQKPVALYKWLLKNYAEPGMKILDTHLGSMSIAIACHDHKSYLTGFEIDEDYYEKGCQRVQNHVNQLQLFR